MHPALSISLSAESESGGTFAKKSLLTTTENEFPRKRAITENEFSPKVSCPRKRAVIRVYDNAMGFVVCTKKHDIKEGVVNE